MDHSIKQKLILNFIFFTFLFSVSATGFNNELTFSLTSSDVKEKYFFSLKLLIYNSSNDTVIIEEFANYIPHKMEVKNKHKGLNWKFTTILNEEPEYIMLTYIPDKLTKKRKRIKERYENTKTLTILPNSFICEDIFLYYENIFYPRNHYYKVYLYKNGNENPVNEIVIYYKSNNN